MNNDIGVEGYRYAVIPEWILDAEISPYSVRLFGVLSRYVGNNEAAWPSRKLLATRMNCSIDRVDASIKELTELGALGTSKRKREDGSYTSNFYYLWPLIPEGVAAKTPLGSRQNTQGVAAKVLQHERTLIERTSVKDISPVKKKRGRKSNTEYSAEFEELWEMYPRPVDKKGTYGCFNARLAEGVSIEEMKMGREKYIKLRSGEDLKYTMLPKTFFGPAERWKEFLPKECVKKNLDENGLISAVIYDQYDLSSSGKWFNPETGQDSLDNPALFGYNRPTNDEGQLVNAQGEPYSLDAQGIRRSINYWK